MNKIVLMADKTITIPEEFAQQMQGAEVRKAIILTLIKKMDELPEMAAAALSLTQEEYFYLRDLLGNQWGEENEFIRRASVKP